MESATADDSLRGAVADLMTSARDDLAAMVGYASVFDAAAMPPPPDCDALVDWLVQACRAVGFSDAAAHLTADGSKSVIGHLRSRRADAPTVLLYAHHDVQPPLGADEWLSSPWELTERDGRWFGRGAADCKGNIAVILTALRALAAADAGRGLDAHVTVVLEGSEEQGTGGLEEFVPDHVDLLRADAILILDAGNFAVGQPALTTSLRGMANMVVSVSALSSAVHSGMFGGAAPDALAALIAMLSTLRDAHGNTTIAGLDHHARWPGEDYPAADFRRDATVLDGVELVGDGRVGDMVWARPAATVLGIDCPPVVGSAASIVPAARARINLRVPPGVDVKVAQDALAEQLRSAAPWNVRVEIDREADGAAFAGSTSGPGFDALTEAMTAAYGTPVRLLGQGGSIPLCNVFAETYPDAEIMLLGVEEPSCLIHAPNESVDPSEIENLSFVLARFLRDFARR